MRRFYTWIVKHRRAIFFVFIVLFAVCLFARNFVAVNYDMNDYLPKDSSSTVSIEVMQSEFGGGIPNARVMIRDVSVPEALEYKERIKAVHGVTGVSWLDDSIDITVPLSMQDSETVESYYKDGTALFSVTIASESRITAVPEIRAIVGDKGAMSGSAVSTADAMENTVAEIRIIAIIAVVFVLVVLLLTTRSWTEPFLVLGGLGVAIVINSGTNLIFGEISFVTNAACSILQLAVSLDYSVFLIHRFEECRAEAGSPYSAMVDALCKSATSIVSSGLTTVIGFLALVLMRFRIGPDLGLALAKGVVISLITVFLFMPSFILITYKLTDKTRHRSFVPRLNKFGSGICKITLPMVAVFVLTVAPVYLASNANSYYFGSSHIFGPETQLGTDTAEIREVFGESDTYVLLVPKGDTARQKELSDELKSKKQVTGIISYVDTVGAEIPPEYLDSDTLSMLESEHYSRLVITAAVPYEGDEAFSLVEQVRETANNYYPGSFYLAGEGVSTYDLMHTVTSDMLKVNLLAIAAVFLILLVMLRSFLLPVLLVASIETAIWINLAIPYFRDQTIFYIAYLIISTIQLGATVDYAILMTDRYRENRRMLEKKAAASQTVADVTVSIFTSGSALTVVGLLLGGISSNELLSQLGVLIGRGGICSLLIVMLVLPGLLMLFDRFVVGKKEKSEKTKVRGNDAMKKGGKTAKRALAFALSALLVAAVFPARAEAASENTPKEEVVYVSLGADGSVKEINVVNIYELSEDSTIVDFGDYTSLRTMTTDNGIKYSGGKLEIDAKAGKVYCEGKLSSDVMPWKIEIKYFLDGAELTADELAGRSGFLKIALKISKNDVYKGDFFKNYALQASVSLDTDKCKDIKADDATLANVGKSKQLTYTILPGKGIETEITANVTDFETAGFSINGIPLNLKVDIDSSELTESVGELENAVGLLDDGAGELKDGIFSLKSSVESALLGGVGDIVNAAYALDDGAVQLKNGADALLSGTAEAALGAASLESGAKALDDGIQQMKTALETLDANSADLTSGSASVKAALGEIKSALDGVDASTDALNALKTASSNIKSGIDSLVSGISALDSALSFDSFKAAMLQNGLDIDKLKSDNASAVSEIQAEINTLNSKLEEIKAAGGDTSYLESSIETLKKAASLLSTNNTAISGTKAYLNSIGNNAGSLFSAAKTLQTGYNAFNTSISLLIATLNGLSEKVGELSAAIGTLNSEYEKLDEGLNAYTAGVSELVSGFSQISSGSASLSAGSIALKSGIDSLNAGAGSLAEGAAALCTGTASLKSGSQTLKDGTDTLYSGISTLYSGSDTLKFGLTTLRNQVTGMSGTVSEKIDDVISSFTGDNSEPKSFVSEKNTNIKSVQFVIKTDGVSTVNPALPEEAPKKKLSLWQKILKLFGLYDEE